MTKRLASMLVCLLFGLAVAGCGGDDDNGSGDQGSGGTGYGPSKTEQPAGDGGGGGGAQVSIESFQFLPADVTVKAGDTITFTNNEDVGHDVHKSAGPGADFGSGPTGGLSKGDTFELTLKTPGKYEYICVAHKPDMVGEIVVK